LVENLLASVSQHQRQKGAEQTKNRMRSRFQNGYWPFIACVGLKHVHRSGEGRVLVRDEPLASVIQEGLEGFASGRFQQQIEVARFFGTHPNFPKDAKGKVRQQLFKDIMTKPIYAGYMEAPADWGLPLHKGRHAPIISYETYQRVQERLSGTAYAPARADTRISGLTSLCAAPSLLALRQGADLVLRHPQNRRPPSVLHVLRQGLHTLRQVDQA